MKTAERMIWVCIKEYNLTLCTFPGDAGLPASSGSGQWVRNEQSNPLGAVGQATKGNRRMPWGKEPMKGAVHSDMPRGAANKLRSEDARMG